MVDFTWDTSLFKVLCSFPETPRFMLCSITFSLSRFIDIYTPFIIHAYQPSILPQDSHEVMISIKLVGAEESGGEISPSLATETTTA